MSGDLSADLFIVETDVETLADGTPLVVMRHPEFPGCHGFGADEDEARRRLGHARDAYLAMGIKPIYHPLKVYPGTTS